MKNTIINSNQEILITVLNGLNCKVLCSNIDDLEYRIKSFIKLLNLYDIDYAILDNKIRVKDGFVVFSIKINKVY